MSTFFKVGKRRQKWLTALLLITLALPVSFGMFPRRASAATEYIAVVRNNDFTAANADTTGNKTMKLSGTAMLPGNGSIRLVNNTNFEVGGTFLGSTKMSAATGFSMFFNIYMGENAASGQAADGWMFVIAKNSNQIGATGAGIGYQGITNSIGIEYDTWDNSTSTNGSASTPHVAYGINGRLHNYNASASISNSWDNLAHGAVLFNGGAQAGGENYNIYCWVDYNSTTQQIYYYLSTTRTRPTQPILTIPTAQITASGIGNEFYIGFSSATGVASQQVFLHELYIAQDYHPGGLDPDDNNYVEGTGLPTAYITHTPGASTVTLSGDDVGLGVQSGIKTIQYAVTAYGTGAPAENSAVWVTHQNSTLTRSGQLYSWANVSITSGQTIHARAIDKENNISAVV
ncbi:MAG: hypothetical protein LBU58_11195, partial [Clostridiales bacterium]|nr:hypothetical protein [Clostridiales bacterium]